MLTSFSVKDMTIHRIVEQEQGFTPLLEFLPTLTQETLDENLSWLAPGAWRLRCGDRERGAVLSVLHRQDAPPQCSG